MIGCFCATHCRQLICLSDQPDRHFLFLSLPCRSEEGREVEEVGLEEVEEEAALVVEVSINHIFNLAYT